MYNEVTKCRMCGSEALIPVLHLGNQSLTGVFPANKEQKITCGPLELVKCDEDTVNSGCGLLQLRHSYDLSEMYGLNYGYRSGLNRSMVEHLHKRVEKILGLVNLQAEDLVIDIGSNDSTLWQAYPDRACNLVGIDPTGKKFSNYYPSHIRLIPDFFSAAVVRQNLGGAKARVISSIAMFYDLESPLEFMREIAEVLASDGVWVFEQSYMPTMLEMNAYDTICHEHLEYYGLHQIKWMTDRVGFKIIDVELNSVNGGSFAVTVAHKNSNYPEATDLIDSILADEARKGLNTLRPYREFAERVFRHRDDLIKTLKGFKESGKKVLGYGASTKGNVILQFCNLTAEDIPGIAEVNPDKFGKLTPGTFIPIISEEEAREQKPDFFLVLPWHFREGIIEREHRFLEDGKALFFPLPAIEVVRK